MARRYCRMINTRIKIQEIIESIEQLKAQEDKSSAISGIQANKSQSKRERARKQIELLNKC